MPDRFIHTPRGLARRLLALAAATALAFAVGQAGATSALADFGITSFDGVTLDGDGDPFTQAGGHPAETSAGFTLATKPNPTGSGIPVPDEQMNDVSVDLPPGVIGDPSATDTKCTAAQLALQNNGGACPDGSRVGTMTLHLSFGANVRTPLFNMVPQPGRAAQFGNNLLVLIMLDATVRSSDYGLTIGSRNIDQAIALSGVTPAFWGVPADHGSGSERRPLLTQPTSCTGPLEYTLHASSWQEPSDVHTASFLSHDNATPPNLIGQTGCENVPFDPTVNSQPTTTNADSPTGLAVDISIPTDGIKNPDGISQSHLKDVTMTFPEGMAVNPSAADGLGACSEAQVALGEGREATCPQNSKIGTVELTTPVLTETLKGGVYQAEQDANPFNSTLAIYINAVNEERGIDIKLAGEIATDPDTGRITATFKNNPQLPLKNMHLTFKAGSRAPLVTPPTCGTYEIVTELTPWARPDEVVTKTSEFTINRGPSGGPCLAGDPNQPGNPADLASRPFNPQMTAGVTNPVAGSASPFTLRLTRQDGEQEILATTVTPPKGVTAKLAGVPLCSDARANAGTCPAASQIGEVIVGAGAGPSPFYIQPPNEGHVYMTGPYKGEQLGMLIQVPAKAGPFDLGLVNVRAAVHVDKHTAQLRVISDPIPQILEGIPLRTKDIRVLINRPDFTIAPTDCDPMTVQARVRGSSGASAHLINRFQVGGCASLGFNPRLKLDFGKRRKDTRRNQHPPLHANLNFNQGDANISYVQVALPKGVFLDQDRLGRICSRPNYAANTCPAESRVGYAKATTPLLDDPVEGPVYLKSSDNPLPDLAADLNGQIDIDLFGKIDQKENKKGLAQIRNTFDVVPDVPVSHFSLTLSGGKDGLLVNSRNICRKRRSQKISIEIKAHNEMRTKSRPLIGSACKKINKKKAKKLRKKIKKLRRKAKKANSHKRARKARHKGKKLKKQLRKLRR